MLKCNNGEHYLVAIHASRLSYGEAVVRWCRNCGSVVVDLDYDNRTRPGGVRAMVEPEIWKKQSRGGA